MYKIKQNPEDFFVSELSNVKIADKGSYSYFLLKKRGYTTVRALQRIAEALRIPLKRLGFAGTKDKNAVTEQVASVKGVGREELEKIKINDIEIKFLGKGDSPICLGDLKGNYFRIIVRDAAKKPKNIVRFRNLFGEQRFSKNNAKVGKAIIKRDFKSAVGLIMQNKGETEEIVRDCLQKSPNDFVGALRKIPLKILRMYVHSYQSLLWNRLAEKTEKEELPIIGFGTAESSEIKEIIKKEGIKQRDFVIREMPELSSEGTSRKVFAEAENLKIRKIGEKEYELEFFLPKGSYATVFARELFG